MQGEVIVPKTHDDFSLQTPHPVTIGRPHDVLSGHGHVIDVTVHHHHHWNAAIAQSLQHAIVVTIVTGVQDQDISVLQAGWIGDCAARGNLVCSDLGTSCDIKSSEVILTEIQRTKRSK